MEIFRDPKRMIQHIEMMPRLKAFIVARIIEKHSLPFHFMMSSAMPRYYNVVISFQKQDIEKFRLLQKEAKLEYMMSKPIK